MFVIKVEVQDDEIVGTEFRSAESPEHLSDVINELAAAGQFTRLVIEPKSNYE